MSTVSKADGIHKQNKKNLKACRIRVTLLWSFLFAAPFRLWNLKHHELKQFNKNLYSMQCRMRDRDSARHDLCDRSHRTRNNNKILFLWIMRFDFDFFSSSCWFLLRCTAGLNVLMPMQFQRWTSAANYVDFAFFNKKRRHIKFYLMAVNDARIKSKMALSRLMTIKSKQICTAFK